MATLSRTNWTAQQRLDLHHLLAAESYAAFDFRALISAFTGNKAYVLRGFEVVGKTGLSLTFKVADSMVFNPSDGNGAFYVGMPTDADILLDMPADQENLFVEATFKNVSQSPINTAFWDPLALTGDDVAGTEYSAATNSQVLVQVSLSVNTVGFSDNAFPILRATTDGNSVVKMIDCRPMFFRLGSGGTSPNPGYKFPWGTSRQDPVASGAGVGDDVNSPFRSKDGSGIVNDKGITTLKEWADAVMSRISEISGSSIWYTTDTSPNNPLYGYVTGLDIPRVFMDSDSGHSIQASASVSFRWSRNTNGALTLSSQGPTGSIDNQSTVRWQVNYGPVSWELGGTFVNNNPGGTRTYSESRFEAPAPVDGGNIYLLLERDVVPPLASGNAVKWADNTSYNGFDPDRTVSGVASDFTGIAVGDWIRKTSEGASQYYRVTRMSNGSALGIRDAAGDVADSTIVAVELDRDIATGASSESMLYFRARYSEEDLFSDQVIGRYNYRDSNFYWMGRRIGETFMLRGFGNMQEGEETLIREDASMSAGRAGTAGGGSADVTVQHENGAVYNDTDGYSLRDGGPQLIKIRRRKRDNFIGSPDDADNTDGFIEYTIAAPVGLMEDGDGLWVRLSDVTGGALMSGVVTNDSDDTHNTDVITNTWEVRSQANNPLRNFDNKDVMLLARRITQRDGQSALLFFDGSQLNWYGVVMDQYMDFQSDVRFENDVYLHTKTPMSVLFIDKNPDAFNGQGRIDEDNEDFNYDKENKVLNVFNNLFGVDVHDLENPTDQHWFRNLGDHTLYIGGSQSTTVFPGDIVVLGTQSILSTQNVATTDRNLTLGIGNMLYGGGGSGLSVADNTLTPVTLKTYAGVSYVDLVFAADPGYVLGQLIGIESNFELAEITASDASAIYTMVAVGSAPGDMQQISATTYRIWTTGTADATLVHASTSAQRYRSFDLLSGMMLTGSDGSAAGMSSWWFGVKRNPLDIGPNNTGTVYTTVTPYESSTFALDFKTVPSARHSNFSRTRIPYAWKDGVGAGGSDTTFDFTDRLTWDFDTFVFRIEGTLLMRGNILPQDDNTWDIGNIAQRWKTLHTGPAGTVVHNDATNTNYAALKFVGSIGTLATDAATQLRLTVNTNAGLLLGVTGVAAYQSTVDTSVLFKIGSDVATITSGAAQTGLLVSPHFTGGTGTTTRSALKIAPTLSGQPTNVYGIDVRRAQGGPATLYAGIRLADETSGGSYYGVFSEQTLVMGQAHYFIYGYGNAHSYFAGSVGFGENNQTILTQARVVIGTSTDTTPVGGLLFGAGLSNIYRHQADGLKSDADWLISTSGSLTVDGPTTLNGTVTLEGLLAINGPVNVNYASVKTANYTVTDDDYYIPCDTNSVVGSLTLTLPLATAARKGRMLIIKDVGGVGGSLNKNIILAPSGTNKIDGSTATFSVDGDYYSVTLVCNGVDGWDVN